MTPAERRARQARKAIDFDMNYGTVTGRFAQPGPDPWQLPKSHQPLRAASQMRWPPMKDRTMSDTKEKVTPKELLITARNILDTKGWTRNTFARNINGRGVQPEEAEATCFCALGALYSASNALFHEGKEVGHSRLTAHTKLVDTLRNLGTNSYHIPGFNDDPKTTKEDVLVLFDLTIETLPEGTT